MNQNKGSGKLTDAWKTQELKCWPEFYRLVESGRKNFEVRKFDRPFAEGTKLIIREWDNEKVEYTGRQCVRIVEYILSGGAFGIKRGYCVLAIRPAIEFIEEKIIEILYQKVGLYRMPDLAKRAATEIVRVVLSLPLEGTEPKQPKKSEVDLAKIEKAFDDLLESETPESLREWLDKQAKAPSSEIDKNNEIWLKGLLQEMVAESTMYPEKKRDIRDAVADRILDVLKAPCAKVSKEQAEKIWNDAIRANNVTAFSVKSLAQAKTEYLQQFPSSEE